ncbi:hypothetical protein AMTRI_Chr12g269040 [Amborella trichopoda]
MENLVLTRPSVKAGFHGSPTFWPSRRSFSSTKSIRSPGFCFSSLKVLVEVEELADIDWDNLIYGIKPTDYMYMMKCAKDGSFSHGKLHQYGNIELSPSAGVLNYAQGVFEGLKAYRKQDGDVILFRPEENALRMLMGAERMCMPSPSVEQFVDAVRETVSANRRWAPPSGKGSLYIRPMLFGSGPILGLAPSPEYTFLIYVTPVGNYFKEGLAPINLIVETEYHRATPGGTGGIKTIGNYAAVLKAQTNAKLKGYNEVLYLDAIHKKYLEEVSGCNIFVVKVEERRIPVEEVFDADEVFGTGCAVVVSPVGSVTYLGKRIEYGGVGKVSRQLYSALISIQFGLTEDTMGWTVIVK